MRSNSARVSMLLALVCALVGATGCGDDSSPAGDVGPLGDAGGEGLSVLLEAEDSITEGLVAGEGDEAVADGWAVRFDQYAIVVGDVELRSVTESSDVFGASGLVAYDLVVTPPSGALLWSVAGLSSGRWQFAYRQGDASEATRDESVSETDFERMVAAECTYLVEGAITREDGRTCPPNDAALPVGVVADADGCYANADVSFSFCVPARTGYGPCELDGAEGVAITSGANSASISIHGDHLFFNGFPEGAEGGVTRLAQWLADCDLNLDGEVTQAELEAIRIDDLAEIDSRFDLGGAPALPGGESLTHVWSYVRAQLSTQGHFNGEGECAAASD